MTDCHWCKHDKENGERLEDCGFFVCRDCIRHMGQYKDSVSWQFFAPVEANDLVDDPEEFRDDMDVAIRTVFESHGLNPDSVPDEWEVINGN